MHRAWVSLAGCGLLTLCGCVDLFGPDVGPQSPDAGPGTPASDPDAADAAGGASLDAAGGDPPGCNADSDPDVAVSFSIDLLPEMGGSWNCLDCHVPGREGYERSGLDLSTYTSLRAGGFVSGADIVIAGNPCDSVLVLKLVDPPFGSRMPKDDPALPAGDIQNIRDWIAEGAVDN